MYIPIDGIIPVPELWTALMINPKTPIGANRIIKAVINIIESYKDNKIGSILFLRSVLIWVIDIPKINAKKIIVSFGFIPMWPKKKGLRIVNKIENNANNSLFEISLINLKSP